MVQPHYPFEDVFETGGEVFLAVAYTPGGAPFGPRVEIVDGELTFPDELAIDLDALAPVCSPRTSSAGATARSS